MSSESPYERVKGGRLTFKGGEVAVNSKTINKKKKKKNKLKGGETIAAVDGDQQPSTADASEATYTIDAAKKMKYEDLFPVEAKKFGYDPKAAMAASVEQALDDRVKKKADRYCK